MKRFLVPLIAFLGLLGTALAAPVTYEFPAPGVV